MISAKFALKLINLGLSISLLLLGSSISLANSGIVPKGKRILLLYSYHPTFVTTPKLLDGIKSVLDPYVVEMDIEYMDSKRHNEPYYLDQFMRALSYKFSRRLPYDVVMVSDDNALNFVLTNQDSLFADMPVVFMAVNNVEKALSMDDQPYITGVVEAVTMEKTLKLALDLHPKAKNIVAIAEDTFSGKGDLVKFNKIAEKYSSYKFSVLSLGAYSWDELAVKLNKLDSQSVVLRLASFRDKDGVYLTYKEMMALLTINSPVPVYSLRDHDVLAGALGGNVVSFYEQGKQAAMLVEKILHGVPVNTIKVLKESPNRNMFNFHAMVEEGIDQSQLPEGAVIVNAPEQIYDKYREYIWAALFVILLLSIFVMFLLVEIKARRRAELELKQHQDQLEDIVASRTKELRHANKELESFSYSVSHDLRAPLRGIDGFSQILMEEYKANLGENGAKLLDRVRKAAQHMSELIDDILELSRVSRRTLTIQPFDLSELTNDIVAKFKLLEPGRKVSVHVKEGMSVIGDKHLIEIAVNNLVDNAWKYTGKNQHADIEIGEVGSPDEMKPDSVFYIKDNGPGFDMKYSGKLFGAFQRLHAVDEYPGTGIGLASVHRVISRHGGKVWADSEIGKGATFYFTLPKYPSIESHTTVN